MTAIEHLEELRRRILACLAVIVAATGVGLWLSGRLIEWLKRPAGDLLPKLAFFAPTEALVAHVQVAVLFGLTLSTPVLLYQIWAFVAPGLKPPERRAGLMAVAAATILFLLGGAFAYIFLLPAFLRFLLTIGAPSMEPVISINRYVSFVIGVMMGCAVMFELPVVALLLVRFGWLTPETMQRQRGIAIIVIMVIAAIVTPTTDAVSLLVMAVPLLVLYEVSIILAKMMTRRSARS